MPGFRFRFMSSLVVALLLISPHGILCFQLQRFKRLQSISNSLQHMHGSIQCRRSSQNQGGHHDAWGRRCSKPLRALISTNEDLPNILGINPLEGALIFGVLYYIYGPDKLYEVVREAGRLFSTYGPVVKEIATDVYYEFRDYLEENRERDELRKQGVDIDSIPRRTSNIFERFQESMDMLSEASEGSAGTSLLASAYRDEGDGPTYTSQARVETRYADAGEEGAGGELRKKRRKSKKEVLEERNVDVQEVVEATERMTGEQQPDATLKESLELVQSRFTNERTATPPPSMTDFYKFPDEMDSWDGIDGNNSETSLDDGLSAATATIEEDAAISGVEEAEAMKKFQQQLSGSWNQQVIDKTSIISAENDESFPSISSLPAGDEESGTVDRVIDEVKVVEATTSKDKSRAGERFIAADGDSTAKTDILSETIGMSKFQQQMSGEWNERVMRRDRYGDPRASGISPFIPTSEQDAASFDPADEAASSELSSFMEQGSYDAPFISAAEEGMSGASVGQVDASVGDIPEELSVADLTVNAAVYSDNMMPSPTFMGAVAAEKNRSLEILKEIDRDYASLRSKFLHYIDQQEQQLEKMQDLLYEQRSIQKGGDTNDNLNS